MDADQGLQLVVDQRGIDVVVRVFSPEGKSLGEFDSPNGAEGPENVSVLSVIAGAYRIEVAPLGQLEDPPPGRYEIKIVELRAATEQELRAGKNQVALKTRGIALLTEVADTLPQIHLPHTRVRAQLQAARLLWGSDEKLAARLVNDAIDGIKECLSRADLDDPDYNQTYGFAMQLRQELIQMLGPHDPETALAFLRATRVLASPDSGQDDNQRAQEMQLELSLAGMITGRDPKRTFQIAEETLKNGYSSSLSNILMQLRTTDPELAVKLAKDIAAKLEAAKLLEDPEAANLAVTLLRIAHSPAQNQASGETSPAKADIPLLSEQEYRDLFAKMLADGLRYTPPAANIYSPERDSAQNTLNSLKSMTTEMQEFAPESIARVEKKTTELSTNYDPQARLWQKYQETINNGALDTALERVSKAPREMRDQLYQQLAGKVAGAGDFAAARQILTDNIANPMLRRQALRNLEQQSILNLVSRGKVDEAVSSVANLHTAKERAMILSQIVNQIGPGTKRATALRLLERARIMITTSGRADDQEQMNALLAVARVFARYDPQRGFEVLEPLLDQFNEMSAAASVLNGFGQQYYQDGELIAQNGNSIANIGEWLVLSLGGLTAANFDRAKAGADRLQRQEIRIGAYLAIAQQAITPDGSELRRVAFSH